MAISRYKNYLIEPIHASKVHSYLELFNNCFPNYSRTLEYLNKLYFQNPRGSVIGFDAFDEFGLVAHYACIPIKMNNSKSLSLLSINTAVNPRGQNQGLFKHLAQLTYELGSKSGFNCVIGIANSNSLHGFLKHLEFDLVGYLNLRLGPIVRTNQGTREYSNVDIDWLKSLSNQEMRIKRFAPDVLDVRTKIYNHNFFLGTNIFLESYDDLVYKKFMAITLDWNLRPRPSLSLPKKFKPSPLALIKKELSNEDKFELKSWSLIDFDLF
jgi:hypothetical protein